MNKRAQTRARKSGGDAITSLVSQIYNTVEMMLRAMKRLYVYSDDCVSQGVITGRSIATCATPQE